MGVWQAAGSGSGAGPAGPASLRLPSPGGGAFLPAPGEGGCGLSPEVTICGAGTPGALGALASCREPRSGPGGQRSFANLPLQPACFSPYSPGHRALPPGWGGPSAPWHAWPGCSVVLLEGTFLSRVRPPSPGALPGPVTATGWISNPSVCSTCSCVFTGSRHPRQSAGTDTQGHNTGPGTQWVLSVVLGREWPKGPP